MTRALLALALFLLAACAQAGPQPIDYGRENCEYCRMLIDDRRFAAEIVTTTGKARKFDSIECMASYYRQESAAGKIREAWVSDFRRPGTLIPADSAIYGRGAGVSSPMGMGLAATTGEDPASAARALGATTPLRWADVLALVANESPAHAHDSAGAGH
ncbi:MAG TPA: nitrous oxide reductase accessory protein NosL [Gemmatimonadaceae bacterium]